MHELSLAQEICRLTRERVGREECRGVRVVGVEVGDDAGVEADNLFFCLEVLLEDPPFSGAMPRIHRVEGNILRLRYLEIDDGHPAD